MKLTQKYRFLGVKLFLALLIFIPGLISLYRQTSLIRVSLTRMPHNPNTLPGNLFYHFILNNDSAIRMFHNPNIF